MRHFQGYRVSNKKRSPFQERVIRGAVFFFFLFFLILVRLVYLQIFKHDYFWKLAQERTFVKVAIPAPRGNIIDMKGVFLAKNKPSFNLYIDPHYIKGREDSVLKILAEVLGEDFASLKERYIYEKKRAYGKILFKRGLKRDAVARIEARRYFLPGIELEARPERYYPLGTPFFHPVGYVDSISKRELKRLAHKGYGPEDFVGKSGIEKAYEEVLRGKKGERELERDAFGRTVKIVSETPPVPGSDIYLTLDSTLQMTLFKLLGGRAGAIVVMKIETGEILAMVSSPAVDPNKFLGVMTKKEWESIISDVREPLKNKALKPYHPGSTFKPVTLLAALKAGVVTEDETFYCPGYYRLGRRTFRCWQSWGHGVVDIVKAMAESCDVYFYALGERLDIDFLADFARACGFGRPSGVGLPSEHPGIVPDREWKLKVKGERWHKGETLIVAIGQGALEVNLLQVVKFYGALANGGKLYKPILVKKIVNERTQEITDSEVEGRLPVPKHYIDLVNKGLVEAVNSEKGTGRAAKLKEMLVAGKTGTAQVVKKKKRKKGEEIPYKERDHAWFVAFAPADDPSIVVGVFIEHGGHGGSAAAPLAKKVFEIYFLGSLE